MTRTLIAALVLLGACAHGPRLFRPSAGSAWNSTLSRAQELAIGGRFEEADQLLARHAADYPNTDGARESLYWRAVVHLDPANASGSVDTAVVKLEQYLGAGGRLGHLTEAAALRWLARTSQQLARVEAALREARADATERPRAERSRVERSARRDEEAVREIQRLRDELSKANAELERIKKRLAEPKPPPA